MVSSLLIFARALAIKVALFNEKITRIAVVVLRVCFALITMQVIALQFVVHVVLAYRLGIGRYMISFNDSYGN